MLTPDQKVPSDSKYSSYELLSRKICTLYQRLRLRSGIKPRPDILLRENTRGRKKGHGLKNAGSFSALIMVSTMSAAAWSSRSSKSSHILRRLARIGAFSEGSRSIRVRAMQKAIPSVPIRVCSMVGLLMAGSFSNYARISLSAFSAPLLDQIAAHE